MGEATSISYKTTGSTWLSPLSDIVGVPLDQVNFLACQAFALTAAFWFRLYLSPRSVSPVVRHAVATLLGTSFIIFCFGWYSAHVFVQVLVCYGIMSQAGIHNVHRYSMVMAMGYLTLCQITRVFVFNYGVLSTDFSGPLMMITQKITMLAFQLHDGMCKKEEELTPEQRRLAIRSRPSLLEYLSYNLNFLSILVGPCSTYKDYIDFIEGRHARQQLKKLSGSGPNQNGWDRIPDPSPVRAVIYKLLICAVCMFWFLTVSKAFPVSYNVDPQFISEAPLLTRLAYTFVSVQGARPKFYFAWTLADAIHNAAGYGIRGVDEKGEVSWDLVSNIRIWEIETATSFKTFIDNWNMQTGVWLKCVCYDRAPQYHMVLTFVLSALWHGVYPGYYFTFLTGIPITMAARTMRRNFRHYFLRSRAVKLGYDVVTWAATQFTICYTVMPFLVLAVEPTIQYYKSVYFHVHIISILAVLLLPKKPRHPIQAQTQTQNQNQNQDHTQLSNNNVKGD
ncbi:lysophospholipid acyltransferase 1 [Chanos chanos]|uniref:Lysophospholipid acyltransferase 1 n=1 Tax=Chanos chanos TaxID=29144 RepID=A0A6J2W4K8_CHACN|nr:lysophospholipid acyltransferase 1 [Chanos chanos]